MIYDNVREALLQKRAALLTRRLENLKEAQELYVANEVDPADIAADQATAKVFERLSDEELAQLQRIGRALNRLEAGSYGTCVVCGGHIPLERLAAIPEADRCLGCTNSH